MFLLYGGPGPDDDDDDDIHCNVSSIDTHVRFIHKSSRVGKKNELMNGAANYSFSRRFAFFSSSFVKFSCLRNYVARKPDGDLKASQKWATILANFVVNFQALKLIQFQHETTFK